MIRRLLPGASSSGPELEASQFDEPNSGELRLPTGIPGFTRFSILRAVTERVRLNLCSVRDSCRTCCRLPSSAPRAMPPRVSPPDAFFDARFDFCLGGLILPNPNVRLTLIFRLKNDDPCS